MVSRLFNLKLFLFIFILFFINGCKTNKVNQEPILLIIDSTLQLKMTFTRLKIENDFYINIANNFWGKKGGT